MKAEILKTDIERAIGEAVGSKVFISETKEDLQTTLRVLKRVGKTGLEIIYERTSFIGNPYKNLIIDFITLAFFKDDRTDNISTED